MTISKDRITITLENDDINTFQSVIMFALDFNIEQKKKGKPCMTETEEKMANRLVETVNNEL